MANDTGTFTEADAPTVTDAYTASATDINVQKLFEQFGYYPTQAEVTSLGGSFSSANDAASKQFGVQAISQYVLQQKQNADFAKNDPLAALQTAMTNSAETMKKQVTGLYGQLQDVLGSAPQLFGNLTPDQITGYLAPLQTAFKAQLDTVQGALGSRGLWGSSTEANALAQTGAQFQEQVLSTGLQVGQTSQNAKATAIQNQINSLLGLTGTEEQISGAAAGQRSKQNLGQSNLVASLPYFLQQSANQQALINQQLKGGKGGSAMDIAMGSMSGALQGGAEGFMVGGPWGAAAGAAAGGAAGGYSASQGGGGGGGGAGNALFLASLMKKNPSTTTPTTTVTPDMSNNYSQSPDLFQSPSVG
jgi:hypothetical protein